MSGLTQRNQAGQSGLVAPKVDFQRFTSSALYTKPGDVKIIWIECIGGGGQGGGGRGNGGDEGGGGGGGGGAFAWACFSADALPATLDVIVGTAASSAGGGGNGADGTAGTAGNHSQVDIPSGETDANKIILKAFGGGGGPGGDDNADSNGAGGGGTGSAGASARTGGNPVIQGATVGNTLGGGGAAGAAGSTGFSAEYGGGGPRRPVGNLWRR